MAIKSETKNWPHVIIDFLYKKYSETWTELNNFLYNNLNLSDNNTTHKDKIKDILNSLKDKGYLNWKVIKLKDDGTWEKDHYEDEFQKLPGLTLKNHRVEAQLTIDGLDYAIELEREKQKHNIYKFSTPTSVVFAVLAFAVSFMTYLRGCDGCSQQRPLQLQLPKEITIDTLSLKKVHI